MSTAAFRDPLVQMAVGTIAISAVFFALLVDISALYRGLVVVGGILMAAFGLFQSRSK